MRFIARLCTLALLVSTLLLSGRPASATEGGGGAYPNGAEDFMSGAVPPPGTYIINYFDYYSADKLATNDGKSALPVFKLNVTADVLRVIHVTNKQILGGFWAMHLFLPVMNVDVTVPGAGKNKTGLGDIIVDPFILAWHGKQWHLATGLDIYMPTGSYDKKDLANVGRNYWTFEPVVAGTYITEHGYEVSAKFMYDFNTKNSDTDYLTGHEFHVDYALGKKIDKFTFGGAGYYYQQVTDDESKGARVKNNNGSVVALGPALKYDYKNMSFSLKYLFETAAYNRPQGDNLWVKFMYAF
ncbi:MAG: transporter [Desulfuromonadales bacterium]